MRNENKTVYDSFLGALTKHGKKFKAKNILDKSLFIVLAKTRLPIDIIFARIFSRLRCYMECKEVKVRKNRHVIPFPIRNKRQTFLIIKWILKSLDIKKKRFFQQKGKRRGFINSKVRKPLVAKLSAELIRVVLKRKSSSLFLKKTNLKNFLKHRSNFHFRW